MSIIREFVEKEHVLVDAALPIFYREAMLPGGDAETYARAEWRIENGGDPYGGDPEDAPSEEEYAEFVKDWCEERLSDAIWKITPLFKGDTLRVYRVITAPADWTPSADRHPGIYWSWDESAAEAHWGNHDGNNVNWQMAADVKAADINWPVTLMMNASPSYEDEKEIRLNEHTPVEILSCKRI